MEEEYLGDGLYVSLEHGMLKLRAPRAEGDHVVYLEPNIFWELVKYASRHRMFVAPEVRDNG